MPGKTALSAMPRTACRGRESVSRDLPLSSGASKQEPTKSDCHAGTEALDERHGKCEETEEEAEQGQRLAGTEPPAHSTISSRSASGSGHLLLCEHLTGQFKDHVACVEANRKKPRRENTVPTSNVSVLQRTGACERSDSSSRGQQDVVVVSLHAQVTFEVHDLCIAYVGALRACGTLAGSVSAYRKRGRASRKHAR